MAAEATALWRESRAVCIGGKKRKNSLKGQILDIDRWNLPEVFDDLKILDYDWI